MKKAITYLFFFVGVFSLNAQITLDGSNRLMVGDIIIQAFDSTYTGSSGNAGANQTWDFSGMQDQERDTVLFQDPTGWPGASLFPNANIGVQDDSSWSYAISDGNEFTFLGSYEVSGGYADTSFFNWTWMKFPTTMGDSYVGTITTFEQKYNTASFGIGVDSVRLTYTMSYESTIDGWGTVTTPAGNWDALRQKMLVINSTDAEEFAGGSWNSISSGTITIFNIDTGITGQDAIFRWWSDDANAKFFVASNDTSSTFDDNSFLMATPADTGSTSDTNSTAVINAFTPFSISVYPNPVRQDLNIDFNQPSGRVILRTILGQARANYYIQKGNNPLGLEEVEPGIYLLEIYDESGNLLETKKIQRIR